MTRRAAPALFLALSLLLGPACSKPGESSKPRPAPDFTLSSIDGNRITLSSHRGEVVLLDFWATWCPPCRAAIPHLTELQSRYRADGFTVLGMNMDQDPEDLVGFLQENTVNYPMLKVTDEVRMAYGGVSSIPMTLVLDRQGRIRHKALGFDKRIAAELEENIEKLLREAP